MRKLVILVSLLVLSLACRREQQREQPPLAVETRENVSQGGAAPGQSGAAASAAQGTQGGRRDAERDCQGGNDSQCGDRQVCVRDRCVNITAGMAECGMSRVHFDTDSADIRDDERPVLERMARCLKADQTLAVVIEGNTDSRGAPEHNLALGDRRATAVARALQNLGVTSDQMRVISFGATNPLCIENDEPCFSKNRRAAIKAQKTASRKR